MTTAASRNADEADGYARLSALCDQQRFVLLADEAERFLSVHPDHGRAHHLLGFARVCLGEAELALAPLMRAVELLPDDPEVMDHLGAAFNLQGEYSKAAQTFEQALKLQPGRVETQVNAGKNQLDLGNHSAAAAHYRAALQVRPGFVDAHNGLSAALCFLGQAEQALVESEAALAAQPELASAHLNRANALRDLGRMDEALQAYDRALVIDPELSAAWNNLADALCRVGDMAQALQAGERAIRLAPDDPDVMTTLGSLYAISHQHADAESLLREVAERQPDNARAWVNLGNILQDESERERCVEYYARAVELDPELHQAISMLLFHLNYDPETSAEKLNALARRYGDALLRRCTPDARWQNTVDPERELRIGLVSGDFCEHPVAYFLEGFLIESQGKGIRWIAYANVLREDDFTQRLRSRFSEWRNILHQPDEAVAARIRKDEIDILIDLSGHTSDSRLSVFARKPAPIQATWLGYVGTTGLPTVDYVIGDPHLFPEGVTSGFVEQPWLLPECYMSFTPPDFSLECGIPPMISAGHVTFGSFNNLRKVNDEVLKVWAEVLRALPEARLLVRAKQLGPEAGRERFLRRLTASGIDLDRVELAGSLPSREEGMRAYQRVDIALDTFPYTGATTSSEALWMGVPVLTLQGDRMLSRVGVSLNRAVGLADWIAADKADYVARAVRFAKNPQELARIRKVLRDQGSASPLGNPTWFSNQFVSAMRKMWRQWCAAQ